MKSAAQEQINAAYSMGATYGQVIRHVILPAAMPEILVGMRIAIGFGWTTLAAAEMVATNVGLGQMVLNASNFLRTDIVIMGIIVIGVVAYLFDLFMRWVETKLPNWRGSIHPRRRGSRRPMPSASSARSRSSVSAAGHCRPSIGAHR